MSIMLLLINYIWCVSIFVVPITMSYETNFFLKITRHTTNVLREVFLYNIISFNIQFPFFTSFRLYAWNTSLKYETSATGAAICIFLHITRWEMCTIKNCPILQCHFQKNVFITNNLTSTKLNMKHCLYPAATTTDMKSILFFFVFKPKPWTLQAVS